MLFLRPDGTQVARYRFIHSLYPHAIAERVPPGWRLRLHQRVGEWLERVYGAQVAAIAGSLAWHFEEAGDYRRAIHYLVLAAGNAAGRFAYADALRVLQQARSLVHHLAADARPALEVELLQRMGDAHYGRGEWIECSEAYEAAVRAAAAGSTSTQVHALRGMIRPFGVLDPDRGIAAIEQAVRLSATVDDPLLRARTELLAAGIRLTYDTWRANDWEICAAANETIHRLSDAGPAAFDRVSYAQLQVLWGDYAGALANLEAGVPKENESTSIMVPMFARSVTTLALLYSGRLGELVQLLRTGRDLAETNGNEPWLFVFREAWLRTVMLDFAGARELCKAMAARSTAAYWRGPSRSIDGIASGYAALERGKYDDAARSFATVVDPKKIPKFFLHWCWRLNAQLGLADAWLASGKLPSRRCRRRRRRRRRGAARAARPRRGRTAPDRGRTRGALRPQGPVDGGAEPTSAGVGGAGAGRNGRERPGRRGGQDREGPRDSAGVQDSHDGVARSRHPVRPVPAGQERHRGGSPPGACRSDHPQAGELVRARGPGSRRIPRRGAGSANSSSARREPGCARARGSEMTRRP